MIIKNKVLNKVTKRENNNNYNLKTKKQILEKEEI